MTERQLALMLYVQRCIDETGVAPSFEEMQNALGLSSRSSVHRLIERLTEARYLDRDPHRARALRILRRVADPQAHERYAGVAAAVLAALDLPNTNELRDRAARAIGSAFAAA